MPGCQDASSQGSFRGNSNAFLVGSLLWQNRSTFARGRFGSCDKHSSQRGGLDPWTPLLLISLPICDNRNAN